MSTRRAMMNALVGRYGVFAIRAVSMVVLARLLVPEDFGHFAIAAAITSVMWILLEFGLQSYLVTQPEDDDSASGTALGLAIVLNVAVLGIATITMALLPDAILSSETRTLALVISAGFLAFPLNLIPLVRLQRQMRFFELSIVDNVGTATQVATAIAFAAYGHGALALAYAAITESVARTIFLYHFAGRNMSVRPTLDGWRKVAAFGRRHTATNVLSSLGEAITTVVLARMLGPAAVGLFNRAKVLILLADTTVFQGIAPVILPALARELRAKGDLKEAYVRKVAFLAVVHWPLFALLALEAERIVHLLLGPDWQAAVGAMRALAVMGLFMPFTQMSFKFYVALGKVHAYTGLQAAVQIARVVSTGLGALHSLELACLCYALSTYGVKAVFVIPALKRYIGYAAGPLIREVARAAAITVLSIAGPAGLMAMGYDSPDPVGLVPAFALSGLGWLAGIILLRHPGRDEILRAVAFLRDRVSRNTRDQTI